MRNDTVSAAGEAMPAANINRRRMLTGMATIPACGLAAIVPAAAMVVAAHDPLLDAINAYRTAMSDYNHNAPDDTDEADAYAAATYAPTMTVIENWDRPAESWQGAIEALRFAVQEAHDFACSDMLEPVLTAALAYFEREARS